MVMGMAHPKKRRAPRFHAGALLASAAARQGITQTELARRLHITQHRVSEIFRSESITTALLVRVCGALNVRLDVRLIKERRAA